MILAKKFFHRGAQKMLNLLNSSIPSFFAIFAPDICSSANRWAPAVDCSASRTPCSSKSGWRWWSRLCCIPRWHCNGKQNVRNSKRRKRRKQWRSQMPMGQQRIGGTRRMSWQCRRYRHHRHCRHLLVACIGVGANSTTGNCCAATHTSRSSTTTKWAVSCCAFSAFRCWSRWTSWSPNICKWQRQVQAPFNFWKIF